MAMFPLGSVLFPGGVLPLHIFETRYQQLLNHALESDRRFGVVLIERGHEVGGGDQRTSIGTVCRTVENGSKSLSGSTTIHIPEPGSTCSNQMPSNPAIKNASTQPPPSSKNLSPLAIVWAGLILCPASTGTPTLKRPPGNLPAARPARPMTSMQSWLLRAEPNG